MPLHVRVQHLCMQIFSPTEFVRKFAKRTVQKTENKKRKRSAWQCVNFMTVQAAFIVVAVIIVVVAWVHVYCIRARLMRCANSKIFALLIKLDSSNNIWQCVCIDQKWFSVHLVECQQGDRANNEGRRGSVRRWCWAQWLMGMMRKPIDPTIDRGGDEFRLCFWAKWIMRLLLRLHKVKSGRMSGKGGKKKREKGWGRQRGS